MKKLVDVRDFSGIIRTVQKIPIQLYYAQSTTGGRLGVRLFKRSCAKAGIQQEIRKREHYEKPSVRRKKKSEAARKRKYN